MTTKLSPDFEAAHLGAQQQKVSGWSEDYGCATPDGFTFHSYSGACPPLHAQGNAAADLVAGAYAHYIATADKLAMAASTAAVSWNSVHQRLERNRKQAAVVKETVGARASPQSASIKPSSGLHLPHSWCWQVGRAGLGAARTNVSVVANEGWTLRTGGAGGNKRWLHATSLGATLRLRVPITSRRLVLEYYKHDELPLGLLLAMVRWPLHRETPAIRSDSLHLPETKQITATSRYIDGRCVPTDHCPTGQGFYHRDVIADFGNMSIRSQQDADPGSDAMVQLTVVNRQEDRHAARDNRTDFSIVAVVGEV